MPEGWNKQRKQDVEKGVRQAAVEICRRLDFMYDHRSVKEAEISWFDKAVLRPFYWECITVWVDGYRRKRLLE